MVVLLLVLLLGMPPPPLPGALEVSPPSLTTSHARLSKELICLTTMVKALASVLFVVARLTGSWDDGVTVELDVGPCLSEVGSIYIRPLDVVLEDPVAVGPPVVPPERELLSRGFLTAHCRL